MAHVRITEIAVRHGWDPEVLAQYASALGLDTAESGNGSPTVEASRVRELEDGFFSYLEMGRLLMPELKAAPAATPAPKAKRALPGLLRNPYVLMAALILLILGIIVGARFLKGTPVDESLQDIAKLFIDTDRAAPEGTAAEDGGGGIAELRLPNGLGFSSTAEDVIRCFGEPDGVEADKPLSYRDNEPAYRISYKNLSDNGVDGILADFDCKADGSSIVCMTFYRVRPDRAGDADQSALLEALAEALTAKYGEGERLSEETEKGTDVTLRWITADYGITLFQRHNSASNYIALFYLSADE